MNWLQRLPGFHRELPGMEMTVLRVLPKLLGWGSAWLLMLALALRALGAGDLFDSTWQMSDIVIVALLILHWTVVFTVALAAVIVWLMKGPAYVADAYVLNDADESER